MKTMNWSVPVKTSVTALVALLMALSISAAPPPERPRRPQPPPDSRRDELPPPRDRLPGFEGEGILTQEQRAELREAMRANRERHQALLRKIREANRELDEAIFAEKFNQKDVRKKAAAIAKLEAERLMLRAEVFAKIRPTLSAEQLQRIKNRRADLGSRLGPRFHRPPPEGRFLPPEERYREPVAPPPEGRFREPERFRPEARLREPWPRQHVEPRFHEPRRPEPQEERPEFRGERRERGAPEFRRDEERPRRWREPPLERDPQDRERRERPPSSATPESR